VRQTLLIVDDADFMRYILRDLFTRAGLSTIAEAGTRDEAQALARSLHPELIAVDTTCATFEGLALIRTLSLASPDARIIAAVRAADPDAIAAATRAGADHTIAKPYDPVDVAVLMRTLQAQPQLV
jgi:two-component system, chemotaxis family, chemotaxis protein CheY